VTTGSPHGKRSLRDLSGPQRAVIGAAGVVQVGLLAAALVDLRRRPAKKVRGDKRLWVAASFVNYVGPLAYFAYGRRR
jgi:phospholipase D-like protein